MNDTARQIYLLVAGLVIGIFLMSVLSYRASRTQLDIVKAQYAQVQLTSARRAMEEHNYTLAAHYYRNLVEAAGNSNPDPFKGSADIWTLSFPFASEILLRIKAHADPQGLGEKRERGRNHAWLADALEKAGRTDEAKVEWEKAAQLLGQANVAQLRKSVENDTNIKGKQNTSTGREVQAHTD